MLLLQKSFFFLLRKACKNSNPFWEKSMWKEKIKINNNAKFIGHYVRPRTHNVRTNIPSFLPLWLLFVYNNIERYSTFSLIHLFKPHTIVFLATMAYFPSCRDKHVEIITAWGPQIYRYPVINSNIWLQHS